MITATNATKRFEDITAVDHICAEVKDGSVYGLIGSNGAGKSTFLRSWPAFCSRMRARCRSTERTFSRTLR